MRSSAALLLEGLVSQTYPGVRLPPLWLLIYQEAIRGNHLLFSRVDVARFEQEGDALELSDGLAERIEDVIMRLVTCADLADMAKVIDSLPGHERLELFRYYKRFMLVARDYIKAQLN